jgi:hypothetical protein
MTSVNKFKKARNAFSLSALKENGTKPGIKHCASERKQNKKIKLDEDDSSRID